MIKFLDKYIIEVYFTFLFFAICVFCYSAFGVPEVVQEAISNMTPYVKMGGGFVLSLIGVALVFGIAGFAVSAGWRLGKRLEK